MIQLKNIGHFRGVCQSKWRQVRFQDFEANKLEWTEK